MSIKIALPKGRLLPETAALLQESQWGISGYGEGARYYRMKSERFPRVFARLFHEKDIPIQIALGNYDLGICGLDWVEELLARYPSMAVVKVRNLGYGESPLCVMGSPAGGISMLEDIRSKQGAVRIVSEYPNLAESFAIKYRLKRFNIFPVWGAAEAYPPENAELALISGGADSGLVPVCKVLDASACVIANRASWESKDLGEILDSLKDRTLASSPTGMEPKPLVPMSKADSGDMVWLALPDGHQQKHTIALLNKAGIQIDDYPSKSGNRRPQIRLDGVRVKVIRPQDMPMQVANGNFDLAITGRDWVKDHLAAFPSSPVVELLDLEFGRVKIVAVVAEKSEIADVASLKGLKSRTLPFRVASEYVNIADKFARVNHLGRYRIVPTWGASEAFVPEDADVLIENTETGQTLARHNLRIIDTLFESTACLISNKASLSGEKGERIKTLAETMKKAVSG